MVALSCMLLVPLSTLDDPRPSPLGWHMYAGTTAAPSIEVTLTSGLTEDRDLGAIAAHLRPEPDYTERAAQFICARESTAESVRFTRDLPALDRKFLCEEF